MTDYKPICPDCQKVTSGRCWRHSSFTISTPVEPYTSQPDPLREALERLVALTDESRLVHFMSGYYAAIEHARAALAASEQDRFLQTERDRILNVPDAVYEQAGEAADREAAEGALAVTATTPDPPPAVAPLDVERLAQAILTHVQSRDFWHRCGEACAKDLHERLGLTREATE